MSISGRMLLRLKECIEVIERVPTKLFVGISLNPISKKISLNELRTFSKGWRFPAIGRKPFAFMLYGLRFSRNRRSH